MSEHRDAPPLLAEKAALIDGATGVVTTYGKLFDRSARAATWLVSLGLEPGQGIALLLENRPELLEVALAAKQAGLYYTVISTHLTPDEASYIVRDSGARLFLTSACMLGGENGPGNVTLDASVTCVCLDEPRTGWLSYEEALRQASDVRDMPDFPPRPIGRDLLYSSGTTGQPKGVKRPLTAYANRLLPDPEVDGWRRKFGFDADSVYLSTAPLYHAAPLRYAMRLLGLGGTIVFMPRFEAQTALALMERHCVTHSQWVPTMFQRLLKLPAEVREGYDLSSLRVAVHAAAPCPVAVKQAMLDWWGDVIYEYYAGSEGVGATSISPQEWRTHPGSVGRAMAGVIHVLDDAGKEVPTGDIGTIYFEGVASFSYLNDPEKTRSVYNERGWATYNDIGHLDADGFLYLSDRRSDLILSGGVNVYPQEIENAIAQHPAVEDVAVIGIPNEEFGEVPKAVVQLRHGHEANSALADELAGFCTSRLSRIKLPRSVVFEERIPRLDNGKLLRRVLKDRYRLEPDAGYPVRPEARTDTASMRA
jgi:acyl-CoA synthetase (AMP-forming)/AMP-acid ligase II